MRGLTRVPLGRAAPVLLALAVCGPAAAQVSGSVALVSDYLYRGVSLSKGESAPQLTLVYDNPDGWYLAAFASRIRQNGSGWSRQFIGYAGYARRLASGRSWEVGASSYAFPDASGQNFRELFAGLASERVGARVSYAPNYLGQGARTVYAELNASHGLRENLNLFVHAGYFGSLKEGWARPPIRRADVRVGLGLGRENWEFQLAWAGAHQRRVAGPDYPAGRSGDDSLVLNIMRRF